MVTLDKYQRAYVEAAKTGRNNTLNSAVAGAGKTTMQCTLYRELCKMVYSEDVLIACLNTHNKKDLQAKLGDDAPVRTYDSLAWGLVKEFLQIRNIKSWQASSYKSTVLAEQFAIQYYNLSSKAFTKEQFNNIEAVTKLYDFCMNTLTDMSDYQQVEDLADLYGLDLPTSPEFGKQALSTMLRWGVSGIPRHEGYALKEKFTFPELRWCVFTNRLKPYRKPKFVLTDERQDSNAGQNHIVNLFTEEGVECAVGDRNQQLYMFMGANPEQWNMLSDRCDIYDSPISYRCPIEVVEYAQTLVPRIMAAPNAKQGAVLTRNEDFMYSNLSPGDAVLSHTNADALNVALRFLSLHNKPMRIIGRDVAGMLNSLCKQIERLYKTTWNDFAKGLEDWRQMKVNFLSTLGKDTDEQEARINDQALSLGILYNNARESKVQDMAGFKSHIESFYTESEDKSIPVASTIHKAKGLQFERTFIAEKNLQTRGFRKSWQGDQYRNAQYVAVTRATDTMVIVKENTEEEDLADLF